MLGFGQRRLSIISIIQLFPFTCIYLGHSATGWGRGVVRGLFPPFPGPRLAHGIKVKIAPARRVCSSFLLTDRFSGYASSTSHNNSQQPRHSRARAIPLFSIMPGLVFRDPPPWNPLSNATIIRKGKKIHAKTDMITNFVARGDKRAGKQSNISRSKEIR